MTGTERPLVYSIGTSPECDVVFNGKGIQPIHCQIRKDPTGWSIVPKQGKIGRRSRAGTNSKKDDWKWHDQPFATHPSDDLWMTEHHRLPWPDSSTAKLTYSIGRAVDCDITLQADSISGRHALLIRGARETFVLRDLNSRNGLFHDASLKHRVASVAITRNQVVFFGSKEVDCGKLIHAALQLSKNPPETTSSPPSSPRTPPTVFKRLHVPATAFVATLVIVALSLGLWSYMSHKTGTKTAEGSRSVSDMSAAAGAGESSVGLSMDSESSKTMGTNGGSVSAGATNAIANSLISSLYWVTVHHPETQSRFRVGSALAHRPSGSDTPGVFTPASVIDTLESLLADGFRDPTIVPVTGGSELSCGQRIVPQIFRRRSLQSQMIEKKFRSSDEDQAAIEFAMEARSAVDAGWIEVPGLNESRIRFQPIKRPRPGQRLNILGAGYDQGDPILTPDTGLQAEDVSQISCRIIGFGSTVDSIEGVIKLSAKGRDIDTTNLIGLPLLENENVVGVIVYQSVPDSDNNVYLEAVQAGPIGKTLQLEN